MMLSEEIRRETEYDWVVDAEAVGLFLDWADTAAQLEAENDRLREYVQHKPECWKCQALKSLGVGGDLASCTCGLDESLAEQSIRHAEEQMR